MSYEELTTNKSNIKQRKNQFNNVKKYPKKLKRSQALNCLKTLKGYAQIMDSIPGLPFGIGLDTILGLIPGIGDLLTGLLSCMIMIFADQLELPVHIKLLLLKNIFIDFVLGIIPILGDYLDYLFKSNLKNYDIIESYYFKNIDLYEDDMTPQN